MIAEIGFVALGIRRAAIMPPINFTRHQNRERIFSDGSKINPSPFAPFCSCPIIEPGPFSLPLRQKRKLKIRAALAGRLEPIVKRHCLGYGMTLARPGLLSLRVAWRKMVGFLTISSLNCLSVIDSSIRRRRRSKLAIRCPRWLR